MYEYYVTDILRAIANGLYSSDDKSLCVPDRYYDLVKKRDKPQKEEPQETRTAQEVANDIFKQISRKGGKKR